jgi:hypothetical protein
MNPLAFVLSSDGMNTANSQPEITPAQQRSIEFAKAIRIEQENRAKFIAQISPDAKFIATKIVTHMWIIFVVLPLLGMLLYALLKN